MNFNEKVWELTKKIPRGKVTTYKIIANQLNSSAYRAVGMALNRNTSREVPCHRVVGSDGHLVGFAHGLDKKAQMLRNEGIEVKDNRLNLYTYLFTYR